MHHQQVVPEELPMQRGPVNGKDRQEDDAHAGGYPAPVAPPRHSRLQGLGRLGGVRRLVAGHQAILGFQVSAFDLRPSEFNPLSRTAPNTPPPPGYETPWHYRSEEHTSELQSLRHLV